MSDTHPLFAGIGGHHSSHSRSRTDEWLTPPEITEALGGAESFDLDPCSPVVRPWATARRHLTIQDNGLLQPWHGRVYLNPPYSTSVISTWMARMAEHGRGVALIFARTETDTFFRSVWERASALLFMRGRINFHLVDGTRAKANSGAPSVLCAYGRRDADVLALCGIDGQFVPLRLPRVIAVAGLDQTWMQAVSDYLANSRGPVKLDELYRAFARHPKTKSNKNFDAKIRQTLQRGPFRRVGRGEWERAVA